MNLNFKNNKWLKYILNKYFVVGSIFVIWMLFFDQNSYLLHKQLNDDLAKLNEEKAYLENIIKVENEKLIQLKKNPSQYEKIAREKYLMKKENEDIFVIEKKDSTINP